MQDTESSPPAQLGQLDALRQELQALTTENAALRQQLNEQQQSLAFLDAIVQNLPTPVFVKDAHELRFVRLNKAGEALLGLSNRNKAHKSRMRP